MKEKIRVWIRYDKKCRTTCICCRDRKMCDRKDCTPEVVERDPYRGWEQLCKVNKYGKTKGFE